MHEMLITSLFGPFSIISDKLTFRILCDESKRPTKSVRIRPSSRALMKECIVFYLVGTKENKA